MRCSVIHMAVLGLLASLAACGDTGATQAPATAVAPTVGVAPTDSAATPAATSIEPSPAAEPVDLVVLSYSGGAGVPERYGPRLAEALGREVGSHVHLGAHPTELLSGAESGADVVAGADAILMYFPPEGYAPPGFLTCLDALDAVGGDPDYTGPTWSPGQTWDPPEVTTPEDWQAWRDALDHEYEAIWTLRDGRPTIIRGYGGWNPWIPVWRQVGIEAECTAGEEAYDQAAREAAEAHGAVYVSMLDAFTGPTHDQNPAEQGWIADDGMHLSDSGKDHLVETLAAAGFEYNEPPG